MAETVRKVLETFRGQETLEGAGVRLRRLFGNQHVPRFDPFLLLDNFGSADPHDYMAGFPWHPHRGIETVTYMLSGRVAHGDSLGNEGVIASGDVQWMSAGSGIIHQEMPEQTEGRLEGFQLWVNLPAKEKMSTPAYRGLGAGEIPVVATPEGGRVHVIAGHYDRVEGPVRGIPVDPTYLDVQLPKDAVFEAPVARGQTGLAFAVEGSGKFDASGTPVDRNHVALYEDGDRVRIEAGPEGLRFLLVSGTPLHEPVAWYGPIVMNRPEELQQAIVELRRGDFVRDRRPVVEE
ncbi:MAG: pirin family protein [Thermoplasmata archaeon]|nr:pirin family protein [Thermoplasmata archaeon]